MLNQLLIGSNAKQALASAKKADTNPQMEQLHKRQAKHTETERANAHGQTRTISNQKSYSLHSVTSGTKRQPCLHTQLQLPCKTGR